MKQNNRSRLIAGFIVGDTLGLLSGALGSWLFIRLDGPLLALPLALVLGAAGAALMHVMSQQMSYAKALPTQSVYIVAAGGALLGLLGVGSAALFSSVGNPLTQIILSAIATSVVGGILGVVFFSKVLPRE